jgi:hypothetical protein
MAAPAKPTTGSFGNGSSSLRFSSPAQVSCRKHTHRSRLDDRCTFVQTQPRMIRSSCSRHWYLTTGRCQEPQAAEIGYSSIYPSKNIDIHEYGSSETRDYLFHVFSIRESRKPWQQLQVLGRSRKRPSMIHACQPPSQSQQTRGAWRAWHSLVLPVARARYCVCVCVI